MHNLNNIEAVFFDLDDTLYDQMRPFHSAVEFTCGPLNKDVSIEELFKKVRYYSDVLWKIHIKGEMSLERLRIERIRNAFHEFELSVSEQQAAEIQDTYEAEQQRIKAFPLVKEVINELQSKHFTVGIITNGPVQHQMKKIRALKIDRLISEDTIFISDGIGIAKPDKGVFELVQKQMNIRPDQCCYIGDTWENDVVPPLEAGWHSVWFNHRGREPETGHTPQQTISNYEDFFEKITNI